MAGEDDQRALVIAAATALIGREGLAAASYGRVAAESGVRERSVRKLFPELEALHQEVLRAPAFSEVAELVARAAHTDEPVPSLSLLVEACHRLYANAASNWSHTDLEILVRAAGNSELQQVARERIAQRSDNAHTVIRRGAQTGALDPAVSQEAFTHFALGLSVGLAVIDPVATVRPTFEQWDTFIARIGVALGSSDPAAPDVEVSVPWRVRIEIAESPHSLSRLVRALAALNVFTTMVRREEDFEGRPMLYLALLAPAALSADVIRATALSVGKNAYVVEGSLDDGGDLMSRTLDGAAYLVRHPQEAPAVAAALVLADQYDVVEAAEGVDDSPGVLRLQWTPDHHVVLRREWCPFSQTEQVRASSLLRLSAAVASATGDDGQAGWIDAVQGGTVWIRLGRPEDAKAVEQMHDRTSERSRYLRYFSLREWRELQLRRLSGGHRGASLVVMSREGAIVGLGNVFPEGPAEARVAEIALLVEDAYQGRGVGRALMARMLQVAQRLGFTTVAAHLLGENAGVRRLLEGTGLSWTTTSDDGVVTMTADLPANGPRGD
jgi:GNAT superfamily N-acetyltransferase/AcrR family transcriptional regulator